MAKIIYRINPVAGLRSEWFTFKKGAESNVSSSWVRLIYEAKKLGVFAGQGVCKDSNVWFSIKNTSGEERLYKFVR